MHWLKLVWLSVTVVCLAGCGQSGPPKIGASGEIKYNGVPVKDGEIAFIPEAGTAAPTTSAPVIDGKYELGTQWSLTPGTYRIEIRSYKVGEAQSATLPGSGLDRPPGQGGINNKEQLLPAKFNTSSELEKVTVTKGQGAIKKNFDLKD